MYRVWCLHVASAAKKKKRPETYESKGHAGHRRSGNGARVGPALGEPLDPKSGHSSFRRPFFQRGEAWENAKFAGRPTFVPKNLCNQQEIRVSHALVTHLDTL